MGITKSGSALRHLHTLPLNHRLTHYKQFSDAVALIFVINPFGVSGLGHNGNLVFFSRLNSLLGSFINVVDNGDVWIVSRLINFYDCFHTPDNLGTSSSWDDLSKNIAEAPIVF